METFGGGPEVKMIKENSPFTYTSRVTYTRYAKLLKMLVLPKPDLVGVESPKLLKISYQPDENTKQFISSLSENF